jgi:hypothetical protein
MITIIRETYILLLSYNPCDVFTYFNVEQMHGLNYKDCFLYPNTKDDAYIWGWANYVPKEDGNYKCGDARYVFINLQRCADNYETYGGIFHEMMHHSFELHNYNLHLEEEIISWAEEETKEVFKIVKQNL